jgi:hypothetical protein
LPNDINLNKLIIINNRSISLSLVVSKFYQRTNVKNVLIIIILHACGTGLVLTTIKLMKMKPFKHIIIDIYVLK